MKAIKYFMMGALALSLSVPAAAQSESKAAIEQATKIIKAKPADLEKQLKPIVKDNKKNPEVLTGIARAFLDQKDTENAQKYVEMALNRNQKYAPAWILQGDIYVAQDDGGKAAGAYQQAKYADPKNPEGYYRYAMVLRTSSPSEAVANLEELRKHNPTYPVDALAARIYYKSAKPDYKKAISYYDKVQDILTMEEEDITNYAIVTWIAGEKEKSIEICKKALTKNPRKPAWNRVAFYDYTDLKKPTEALDYADRLFNKSDSAHFVGEDYVYYGTALKLANRNDEAVSAFDKALTFYKDNKAQQGGIYSKLSELYIAKGDYAKAVEAFKNYQGTLDEPTFDSMDKLGTLYTEIAAKQTQAGDSIGARNSFKSADEAYAALLQKYPEYKSYGNFMRAQINYNLDPNGKQGLAKPFYENVIEAINNKAEKSNSDNAMLKPAYTYLIVYNYNVAKDVAKAKEWAQKLIEIDPANELAKQVVDLQE